MQAQSGQLTTYDEAQQFVRRDQALEHAVEKVSRIDFTMQCRKLIEESGWTAETCEEVEDIYRKFLALNIRYPEQKLCPNGPVDEFWHAHILDTRKYAADCEDLFGEMLHHYPYFGMRGPDDRADLDKAFADTVDLFIRHFGLDPTAGDAHARACRPQRCP
ncbi:glycine-rich domain-containing protein [Paraburkholderia sp.]|uniref:glycine-rich domain-containing protein n=1 Tax=Paraburkholderia sp. TaxID=1926495 RepID=UPI003C79C3B2